MATTVLLQENFLAGKNAGSQALRLRLARYGLQTEAIDRFVVTQQRQAVAVGDPVALALYLELLSGGARFPEALAALEGSELILHAGDVGDVRILDELGRIAPVHAVHGNTDWGEVRQRLPRTAVVESAENMPPVMVQAPMAITYLGSGICS